MKIIITDGGRENRRILKTFFQIWRVCTCSFSQWKRNPRTFTGFALTLILCYLLSDKVVVFAQGYHTSMQLLEPFIWTFGDKDSILLVSLMLLLLLADIPFLTEATPFYLMRINRRIWLLGQILYICLTTLIYLLFVVLVTSLVCISDSYLANYWSPTAVMLGYSGAGDAIAVPAMRKTMEMASPYSCAAVIFLLVLGYVLVLCGLMLVFTLRFGTAGGILAAFAFSLYGFLLNAETFRTLMHLTDEQFYIANVIVGWISPLSQAVFSRHNFGYDMLPTLGMTGVIDGVLVMALFAAALLLVRSYNFDFTGTKRR